MRTHDTAAVTVWDGETSGRYVLYWARLKLGGTLVGFVLVWLMMTWTYLSVGIGCRHC
jgi:hypothetical protein